MITISEHLSTGLVPGFFFRLAVKFPQKEVREREKILLGPVGKKDGLGQTIKANSCSCPVKVPAYFLDPAHSKLSATQKAIGVLFRTSSTGGLEETKHLGSLWGVGEPAYRKGNFY